MVPNNYKKPKSKAGNRKAKAPAPAPAPKPPGEDKTILMQSITTGVRGVKELMKALAGGTSEFQDLLVNECSVIYECKVCFNLFRSLANFISHKRFYCVSTSSQFPDLLTLLQTENQAQLFKESDIEVVLPDMPPSQTEVDENDEETWVTSDQACNSESVTVEEPEILAPRKKWQLLPKKQEIPATIVGPVETKEEIPATIVGPVETKEEIEEVEIKPEPILDSKFFADMAAKMLRDTPETQVELENMNDSSTSVFQTLKSPDPGESIDSMKVQLIDIDRVFSTNQAVLQENGKFVVTSEEMETEEEKNLEKFYCPHCEKSFLTRKTLTGHIDTYHKERICYPCPLCKVFFASPTGVYRHLSKVRDRFSGHHRTEQQIRRLRPQVLNKARKRLLMSTDTDAAEECKRSMREAEEKWMRSFGGALRCNGCGKRFNRRAVLNVHRMTCRKMEALLRASQSASKAKSTHSKTSNRSPGKNSKSVASSRVSGSGILVRKDYRKTGSSRNKPHNSSLLTEVEIPVEAHGSRGPWNERSLQPIRRSAPSIFNTKTYYDEMSGSSDNSSAACSSGSQVSSAKKKRNSPEGAKSKKGNEKGKKKRV